MSSRTSFDELYIAYGTVITRATGRKWWRKAGIQSQPVQPYATIFFTETSDFQHQVIEDVEILNPTAEIFTQVPWGAGIIDCEVEFFRSKDNDSALEAATRFKNSLQLQERFWDVFDISGLVGNVRLIDISGIFRADTEPRAQVRFQLHANIGAPLPLQDAEIYDIQHETINVTHVKQDDEETEIPVTVDNA